MKHIEYYPGYKLLVDGVEKVVYITENRFGLPGDHPDYAECEIISLIKDGYEIYPVRPGPTTEVIH